MLPSNRAPLGMWLIGLVSPGVRNTTTCGVSELSLHIDNSLVLIGVTEKLRDSHPAYTGPSDGMQITG